MEQYDPLWSVATSLCTTYSELHENNVEFRVNLKGTFLLFTKCCVHIIKCRFIHTLHTKRNKILASVPSWACFFQKVVSGPPTSKVQTNEMDSK